MEKLQIIVNGLSEEQVRKDIEKCMKGWHLFFREPKDATYEFFVPFWGYTWDNTAENLKEIITKGSRVGEKNKHHICVFVYNGEDRFAWCSWTKEVYDFKTEKKYQLEGNRLAKRITDLINALF